MAELSIQQTFDLAIQHHQAGRLREAEGLYRQILVEQPDDIDALHYLGVIAHQSGQNDVAADLIRQAISLDPEYAEAHNNLGTVLKAQGQLDEAIAAHRHAIALEPNYADAYSNLGIALKEIGQLDEAIAAFRQAIALRPELAEAHNNLGTALKSKGQFDEAIAVFCQAIALNPRSPETHNNLGIVLMIKGQLDEAIAAFRQAIALKSDYAEAYGNLGKILRDQAKLDEAIRVFRQVVVLRPKVAEAHNDLGNVLRSNGQLDEAIAAFRQAIALQPNLTDAYHNLGIALTEAGQPDEAITVFRQAIALNPNYAQAYSNLGNAMRSKARLDEAIAAYRQAIDMWPNFADAYNNLGTVLVVNGQTDEAITVFRKAIALKPNFAQAHSNLGNILKQVGRLQEAFVSYRQAIALDPSLAGAHNNLAAALKDTGQLDEAIAYYRGAIALRPNYAQAHSNLVFTLYYHPDYDARAIAEEVKHWNRQHAEPLRQLIRPPANDRNPNRRLRIGYVSPDFKNHPVGLFVLPLLAHHDHGHFEIYCYANSKSDRHTEQFRRHADHWREIKGLSDEEAAELIRADGIDILIDLAGHTADNRLLVFARKPAPVQTTYLGYPATTGMTAIDYRLTDAFADPVGLTERLHTETLVRLPQTNWCFDEPKNAPPVEPVPASGRGYVTFGTFNNFAKVTDPMLRLWGKILQKVPHSRLLLKGHAFETETVCDRVHAEITAMGIDKSRLDLRGYAVDQASHLALYGEMDIALDTFPYNGTQTTCDAFWMGVPVITLAGQTHVSRVGLSLLSNLQLPELIAATPDEYVQIAAKLANDLPWLIELRRTLRARIKQSPLMDAPNFARNVEAAYRQMWRCWCEVDSRGH